MMARFLDSEQMADRSPSHKENTRYYLRKAEELLRGLGIHPNPQKLTRAEMLRLYSFDGWTSLDERYRIFGHLRPFLRFCGNIDAYRLKLDLSREPPKRPRYKLEDMVRMREAAQRMGGYAPLLVHLEQDYGMRRVSVMRARQGDFDIELGQVTIRVKGRGGHQTMASPLHPETAGILREALEHRRGLIEKALRFAPGQDIPPQIFLGLYCHRYARPMSERAIDGLLAEICRRAGVKPRGHHANRRGAARAAYDETLDLLSVQAFLGHKSPEMSQIYIGLDLDRARTAQNGISNAIKGVKVQKNRELNSEEGDFTVEG